MGAITTSGSGFVWTAIAAASFFVASFLALRCWLLVVFRTAAEPTREGPGGGEFVREADADADRIDAVSETSALTGVSGRCRVLKAWRSDTGAAAPADVDGGVSAFGVETTRKVLGTRVAGEDTETELGVGKAGNAASSAFSTADVAVDGGLDFIAAAAALVAAAMFRTPGTTFLSVFFSTLGAVASWAGGSLVAGVVADLGVSAWTFFATIGVLIDGAFAGAGVEVRDTGLADSKAGKSSSWSTGFLPLAEVFA